MFSEFVRTSLLTIMKRFNIFLVIPLSIIIFLSQPGCRGLSTRTVQAPVVLGQEVGNPLYVRGGQPEVIWETVVDAVRVYFNRIQEEIPCQEVGDILTEGLLITYPQIAATMLEPWRRNSVTWDERKHATMQTYRRSARVRVRPHSDGYMIEVTVIKELEALARPSHAILPSATFRQDTEFQRLNDPIAVQDYHAGWIPQGRDLALEQAILQQITGRLAAH